MTQEGALQGRHRNPDLEGTWGHAMGVSVPKGTDRPLKVDPRLLGCKDGLDPDKGRVVRERGGQQQ